MFFSDKKRENKVDITISEMHKACQSLSCPIEIRKICRKEAMTEVVICNAIVGHILVGRLLNE